MARIFIKRKREPIVISNDRAIELKKFWLENQNSDEAVDLEVWTGGVNQIVSIELDKVERKNQYVSFRAEHIENIKRIIKIPVEARSKRLEEFKLMWFMRSGMKEKEPPREVLEKAEKLAFDYFSENKNEFRVPATVFEQLFFVRFGVKKDVTSIGGRLSKKISIDK